MYSPQRQRALEVFEAVGELTPKRLSEHLDCSPEAARQMVRRLVADGILRPSEGGYVLVASVDGAHQQAYPKDNTDSTPTAAGEDLAASRESNAEDGDELPYSASGIWEWNAQTGRAQPWVNPYGT
jgi:DeoR/GlpR family transcriptional regulator of sugar metabolism